MGNKRIHPITAVLPLFLVSIGAWFSDGYAADAVQAAVSVQEGADDAALIENISSTCEKTVEAFNEKLMVQSAENTKTHARMETKNLIYYLDRYPDRAKASGWAEFLQLKSLRDALSASDTDIHVIENALKRFEQDEDGLEMECFTRVRNALRDYVRAVNRENSGNVQEIFAADCRSISEDVKYYIENPADTEAPGRIAATLDFMAELQPDSRGISDIAKLLQSRFSRPNVQISAGKKVLFPEKPIPVSQPTTVQEIVRGTPTYGNGTLTGSVTQSFVPNEQKAEIMLTFNANIKTNTTAVSPMGVSVMTTGDGNVIVKKPLYFDGKDFSFGQATSSSNLNAVITGINTGRGPIGSKVVYDKVGQEFPYSKAESQQLMEMRVIQGFDAQIGDFQLKSENVDRLADFLKKNNYMPAVWTSTTVNTLEYSAKIGNSYQLSAAQPTAQPILPHDLVVRVHQSALNNPLHTLFAGKHLSERDVRGWFGENLPDFDVEMLAKMVEEKARSGAAPAETDGSEEEGGCIEGEDFYFNFCEILPVSVTFQDNLLGVHMRIDSFEQKESVFPGLDIDVVYQVEQRGEDLFLTLQSSEAWPAELERGVTVPARYQVIRRQVKNRMSELLPVEIPIKSIPLKEFQVGQENKDSDQKDKIRGLLTASEMIMKDGWITVGADFAPVTAEQDAVAAK